MTAVPTLPDLATALGLLLRATLLIGAAWVSATALRKAGAAAAARHVAWLLGIAALLALPILWWFGPSLRLPILPAEAAAPALTGPLPTLLAGPSGAAPVSLHAGPPDPWNWGGLLFAVYNVGAAALLVRLGAGRSVLARLWRDAAAVQDAAWEALLAELCAEMRLPRAVALRIARGQVMPMTWGTLAPKLLLPAQAHDWSLERRRLVLLHELAHVARRDSLSRSIASLACALYWFHPGAWLAARQMRIEQEHAADDRVLSAGGSAQAYARSLLHLASGIGERPRSELAATMAGTCQLERRLVSITSPARRDRPGRFFLFSSAAFAALATLVVAAGVPVGPSSAIPSRLVARQLSLSAPASADPATEARASDSTRAAAPAAEAQPDVMAGGSAQAANRTAADPYAMDADASHAHRDGDRIAREGETPGESPAVAAALPLRDYGWQLPRRGLDVRADPLERPAPAGRLAAPPPAYASNERAGPRRWSQIAPRLLLPDKPSLPHSTTARVTPMLSWSIETGPH